MSNQKLIQLLSANEQQAINYVRDKEYNDLKNQFGDDTNQIKAYAAYAAEGRAKRTKKGDSLLILLPGLTGSSLANSNRRFDGTIWINPVAFMQGRLNELDLAPDGVTDDDIDVHIQPTSPIWVVYAKMAFRLWAEYDLVPFPFDWRRSVTHTALTLPDFINEQLAQSQFDAVTLIGHSMGGLVAFDYLTHPSTRAHAEKYVKRCITLGSPFKGTLEALGSLTNPDDPKFQLAQKLNRSNNPHRMLLTHPGLYDMLPVPNNLWPEYDPVPNTNIYDPQTWFDAGVAINTEHLENARRRHVRIAEADPQVPVINVVGSQYKTRTSFTGDSLSQMMQEVVLMRGDGTVDVESAVWQGAEAYYLQEEHIELVLDRAVIQSIMAWAEGGVAVDLASDINLVRMDQGKLRSAQQRHTADEDTIAYKIAHDIELTYPELMRIVTPFADAPVEAAEG